jgi:hypothetical protein
MPVLAASVVALTAMQDAPISDWTLVSRYPSGKVETVSHLSRQFCGMLKEQIELDPDSPKDGARIECVQP